MCGFSLSLLIICNGDVKFSVGGRSVKVVFVTAETEILKDCVKSFKTGYEKAFTWLPLHPVDIWKYNINPVEDWQIAKLLIFHLVEFPGIYCLNVSLPLTLTTDSSPAVLPFHT